MCKVSWPLDIQGWSSLWLSNVQLSWLSKLMTFDSFHSGWDWIKHLTFKKNCPFFLSLKSAVKTLLLLIKKIIRNKSLSHTDLWPFEGTWLSTSNFLDFFLSSVAKDQLLGHIRMIDSPLPVSWILNPGAINPDLKSINKQTKYCKPFFLCKET